WASVVGVIVVGSFDVIGCVVSTSVVGAMVVGDCVVGYVVIIDDAGMEVDEPWVVGVVLVTTCVVKSEDIVVIGKVV
ncbi:MAG: hypothetical protein WC351_03425, partial [Candidatus Izemoplasmatales bacterium]